MNELVTIQLLPLGKELRVPRFALLQDPLFAHGVEFPCGGKGICHGCKIRVLEGHLSITAEDRETLTAAEISRGWRLACRARAEQDLKIELAQWEAAILSDDTPFEFRPSEGLGVAVDLGTTTVVAQLLDLATGRVLAVRAELNEQAKHGADIMSRVEYACSPEGENVLECLIRRQVERMVKDLLSAAATKDATLRHVVLVGNTVMHHLFCGIHVEPLSHYPFEPVTPGLQVFKPEQLGWTMEQSPSVHFLPCLGGFVGSDILAGILATRMHQNSEPCALIDLGTNGEIVVGNRDRLLCTSTAAGPAFEGARISMGMRAVSGAISQVRVQNGTIECHVLGDTAPRGLCGSGLVDAAAAGLQLGWITPRGRLTTGESVTLSAPVTLSQWDIRELQLAKGATAAGLRLLLDRWGVAKDELARVYLAGAFGNYIDHASARRIGLLDFPASKVRPSGNTALLGAKLALFALANQVYAYEEVLGKVHSLSLKEDPRFEDAYIEEMLFPANSC